MSRLAFEIYQSVLNFQYYFRLLSPAGLVILKSQGYDHPDNCRSDIEAIKSNAVTWRRFKELTLPAFNFKIVAASGNDIALGHGYSTVSDRQKQMFVVQVYARWAPILDPR